MTSPTDPPCSGFDTPDEASRQAAFSDHLAACHVDVMMYAFSLVHDMADAEDVCQSVAIILWNKFDQYEPGTDFKHWALRTAKLVAVNTIRRRQRDRLVFSDEVVQRVADTAYREAISQADKQDRWDKITACVEQLPGRQRELLRNFYSDRLSIAELANRVGMTERAVSSALSRSRIRVRSCVKKILQREAKQ